MPASYLPQKLSDFLNWADNFASLITGTPALYGLTAGDATAIQSVVDAFDVAYAISTAPGTRTPVTVQATIDARNAAVAVVRNYARIILANSGVADADKIDLGLIIRDAVNTPIPTPGTNPLLSLVGATPGQLTLSYKDSSVGGLSKAKPFGAVQLQLFVLFGTVAPVTPAATPFFGVFTKSPLAVDTSAAAAGASAYMYGRWVTRTGKVGPWSPLLVSSILHP